jgi:hypothetical protein
VATQHPIALHFTAFKCGILYEMDDPEEHDPVDTKMEIEDCSPLISYSTLLFGALASVILSRVLLCLYRDQNLLQHSTLVFAAVFLLLLGCAVFVLAVGVTFLLLLGYGESVLDGVVSGCADCLLRCPGRTLPGLRTVRNDGTLMVAMLGRHVGSGWAAGGDGGGRLKMPQGYGKLKVERNKIRNTS